MFSTKLTLFLLSIFLTTFHKVDGAPRPFGTLADRVSSIVKLGTDTVKVPVNILLDMPSQMAAAPFKIMESFVPNGDKTAPDLTNGVGQLPGQAIEQAQKIAETVIPEEIIVQTQNLPETIIGQPQKIPETLIGQAQKIPETVINAVSTLPNAISQVAGQNIPSDLPGALVPQSDAQIPGERTEVAGQKIQATPDNLNTPNGEDKNHPEKTADSGKKILGDPVNEAKDIIVNADPAKLENAAKEIANTIEKRVARNAEYQPEVWNNEIPHLDIFDDFEAPLEFPIRYDMPTPVAIVNDEDINSNHMDTAKPIEPVNKNIISHVFQKGFNIYYFQFQYFYPPPPINDEGALYRQTITVYSDNVRMAAVKEDYLSNWASIHAIK